MGSRKYYSVRIVYVKHIKLAPLPKKKKKIKNKHQQRIREYGIFIQRQNK